MAYTKLDDVIVRELWTKDFIDECPELRNILDSGLLIQDAELDKVVNATEGGKTFELPFIADPDYSEPEIMDDSETLITPEKIEWGTQYAMLGMYAKSWKEATILKALSDKDPVKLIRDQYVGKYWSMDLLRRVLKTMSGIAASNIAKNNSDLVLKVGIDDASKPDVKLDMNITIDACNLLGDAQEKFGFICIHSKVYGDLKKADLIQTHIPSNGGIPIQMYGRLRVIVNDLMPVVSGTNKKFYTSMIVQNGALAYSSKNLPSDMGSVDIVTEKLTGHGAGSKQLITRKGQIIHPIGYTFNKSSVAGLSPTLAELDNKDAWERKFRQKNSKCVFVITN